MDISAALAGFGTGAGLIIAIGAQNAFPTFGKNHTFAA